VGGSLVYKTGRYKGVNATAGFYSAFNPISSLNVEQADAGLAKAGKDTFSRKALKEDGDRHMNVLAEAFLEFKRKNTMIKLGRQKHESVLTKSNDTKMIPNTFEGISVKHKIKKTTLNAAYFTGQKLRDHTSFHNVLTYDGWNQNDDSAIHKGLTSANGAQKQPLMLFNIQNRTIPTLKLDATILRIPDMLETYVLEANKAYYIADEYKVVPGIRYLLQKDKGAGAIGGASLSADATLDQKYSDPNSVDSALYAGRVVVEKGEGKALLGYSRIADEADIIAPWRGFPTGGYTRAMAQYNWYANTETWMIGYGHDLGRDGLVPGVRFQANYAFQNFDGDKVDNGGSPLLDTNIFHLDVWKTFANIENLEMKFRMGLVHSSVDVNNNYKGYEEYRFEMNYLF
jgi:hypothetical protein